MNDKTPQFQPNNPLHGIKLADMLIKLEEVYGWKQLGINTGINVFNNNPSHKSALKFLRTTPWAREKIEKMYLNLIS